MIRLIIILLVLCTFVSSEFSLNELRQIKFKNTLWFDTMTSYQHYKLDNNTILSFKITCIKTDDFNWTCKAKSEDYQTYYKIDVICDNKLMQPLEVTCNKTSDSFWYCKDDDYLLNQSAYCKIDKLEEHFQIDNPVNMNDYNIILCEIKKCIDYCSKYPNTFIGWLIHISVYICGYILACSLIMRLISNMI